MRQSLNSPAAFVKHEHIRATPREASFRHGSDFIEPIYPAWKDTLKAAGVKYQALQSAASENRDAWRAWADGESTWRGALEGLLERLNGRTSVILALTK
jgi:hypothetical protein